LVLPQIETIFFLINQVQIPIYFFSKKLHRKVKRTFSKTNKKKTPNLICRLFPFPPISNQQKKKLNNLKVISISIF
jgi:hypothetical protein